MKILISILIVVAVIFGGWRLWEYWDRVDREKDAARDHPAVQVSASDLSGLPRQLENSLREAEKKGASGLKAWLDTYGRLVKDPRRAWIELDYAMALSRQDPVEAKKIFARVKKRIQPDSPVYPRIKALEKTYE